MKLGGYFVNLSTTRKIAERLNIDVGEDTLINNCRMEWPLNNWLHDNGILHMKTGVIKWPIKDGEYGILFISRFRPSNDPEVDDFVEGEKDLVVRKWLMDLDIEGMQCQWATLIDRYGIAVSGIQPEFSNLKFGGHTTMEEILERLTVRRGSDVDKA